MMLIRLLVLFAFLFLSCCSFAQSVVVSEYLNEADVRDEWTELLVITDNTDLIGFSLRDNNGNQTNWQDSIQFKNHSLWNNLRAGTIIIIWHRSISSALVSNDVDTNKADGYIEVNAQITSLFTGGSFGSSPSWAGTSLTIAGSGDILQIRNSSNNHVHALGHKTTVGVDFNSLSVPKINHASSSSSGESIFVSPGASLLDYNTVSGILFTSKSNSLTSFGLPNISLTNPFTNRTYWRLLRQPNYPLPTLNLITTNANYSQFNLSWSSCSDPNPTDSTTGYIVIRNTNNSFIDPSDSITFINGSSLGTASVVANISGSQNTSYIEYTTLACGSTFYYKVYAYRFNSDDRFGNSYNAARGRAYNEVGTNVQSISRPNPIINSITSY